MQMRPLVLDDGTEDPEFRNREGNCDRCDALVYRFVGDSNIECDCGAIYNSGGQRLRDDLHSRPNPSEYDDEIGDMEGYEMAMNRGEDW